MREMDFDGSTFRVSAKKDYQGTPIPTDIIRTAKEFAYEMSFGQGHHRDHRTGGRMNRTPAEIFCNTFQGKLAESVLRTVFLDNGIQCSDTDYRVFPEGIWDDTDLMAGGKRISVKSAAWFSNLLLLESHDYDDNGDYIPNLNAGAVAAFDFYVLVRISPGLKAQDLTISEVCRHRWSYDIAGWISHDELISVIRSGQKIRQNDFLNGKVRMDADNYYVQAGDLHPINELCAILKEVISWGLRSLVW